MKIEHSVFLIFINHINVILSASIKNSTTSNGVITKNSTKSTTPTVLVEAEAVPEVDDVNDQIFDHETHYKRKKRQSGAGKFVDAAKMDEMRLLRMYLQLYKNFFVRSYVGGAHPLHPEVPKVFIQLFKQRIVDFFTPKVGGGTRAEQENQ